MEMKFYKPWRLKPKYHVIVSAWTMLFVLLVLIISTNIGKVDALIGSLLESIGIGRAYNRVAVYDRFLLKASNKDFFEFTSGYNRGLLSSFPIRILNDTGKKMDLLIPDDLLPYVGTEPPRPSLTDPSVLTYCRGFNCFAFKHGRLWGITLRGASEIEIDFGDGEFRKLPVNCERVEAILGPPSSWERSPRGMP
jgi:hypothetical protein